MVGIGSYASEKFSGGAASAKGKLPGFIASGESAAGILDRVADALEAQASSEGAAGAIEGTDSLRKAARMLEMASGEFSANDVPVGARSVGEARSSGKPNRDRRWPTRPLPGSRR